MRTRLSIFCSVATFGLLLGATFGARAQTDHTLFAFQGIYAENGGSTGPFAGVTGNGGANDSSNPFVSSASFTGLNSSGISQTMTISGTAYSSAEYGFIHVYGDGTVTNPYFNARNPVFVDESGTVNPNGSPDTLAVHGNAGWSDKFTFTGLSGIGYKVNYFFRLEGSVSGDSAAGLNFYAGDPLNSYFGPRTTTGNETWVTPDYQVVWGRDYSVSADFFGGVTSDVRNHPEGISYTSYGNYSNTLALTGIQIVNANGNPVSGWSLTSASGTNYPLLKPSSAVPEPGAVALLVCSGVLGGAMFLKRRRKSSFTLG